MEFNSNLNNLFKNFQSQQQYAKKKFDVNGDGKINSKDKTQLTKEEKNIKKDKNLFDVNKDGKFNQDDIDMFLNGDVNGDEKITQEELNFVSAYKKELLSAFKKQKADFEIDGKKYVKGKLASGWVGSEYYKSGVLQYTVQDNNGKDYPNVSGSKINFKNGKKTVSVKLKVGDNAVINKDGTVEITDKNNKKVKYDSKGTIMKDTAPETSGGTNPVTPTNPEKPEPKIVSEYNLKDLGYSTINVNGKEIRVSVSGLGEVSGKITVDENGTIYIYNTSTDSKSSDITFYTNENLNIVIKECTNENFSVHGGSGNDTITNFATVENIFGGDGNDTIINTTSGNVISIISGNGDDTIKNYGKVGYQLNGGDGNDNIINEVTGLARHIDGGWGDDKIVNNGVIELNIDGNEGNDTITNKGFVRGAIDGYAGDDVIDNLGEVQSITGGLGNDTLKNEGKHSIKIYGDSFGLSGDLEANIDVLKHYIDNFNDIKAEQQNVREDYKGDLKELDNHNIFESFWEWLKNTIKIK